jgi:colicin import membrane protein
MYKLKSTTVRMGINAIFFIAACATFHWARGQNLTDNSVTSARQDADVRTERQRIGQERTKATTTYETAKAACYQAFAVNTCLTTTRNQHNAQMADLKRQEISLSDGERKRRGAEQIQRTEEKTSTARQEQTARQRGTGLANDAGRQKRQAAQPATQQASALAAQGRSQKAAGKQTAKQNKAAARQKKMTEAAQTKARSAQRTQDAQAHRTSVEQRHKNNKKKPAAALPIPAN